MFYRSGGRTLARNRVVTLDPATRDQLRFRGCLANAAKTWGWLLPEEEKFGWNINSRYNGRGLLEIVATTIVAKQMGLPTPVIRGSGPGPPTPLTEEFLYEVTADDLVIKMTKPPDDSDIQTNWRVNGPQPKNQKPTLAEIVQFFVSDAGQQSAEMEPAYKAKFNGQPPGGRKLLFGITHYNFVLNATGPTTQVIGTNIDQSNAAWATVRGLPMPRLSTTAFKVTPQFEFIDDGDPIPIQVSAPDFTTSLPATAPNFEETLGTITDTLGLKRTGSLSLTFKATASRTVNLQLYPTVTI